MCGRFSLSRREEQLALALGVPADDLGGWAPRYNIAPSQRHPVVRQVHEQRGLLWATWGMATGGGAPAINARGESLRDRPTFRDAFDEGRRCLVPADGFFEWQSLGAAGRRPYWFHREDGGLLWLVGLYGAAARGDGAPGWAFAIVTTAANGLVGRFHDRMPVILSEADAEEWLFAGNGPERLARLLRPAPEGLLAAKPVSPRVNNVEHDGPELLEREAEQGALL